MLVLRMKFVELVNYFKNPHIKIPYFNLSSGERAE